MKIVIWDAGHGGKDPGASGNGLLEKDVVLQIATEAARQLEQQYEGVKSILTRNTDVFLELQQRTTIANNAKADALISIHCNAGGGQGGFESFIYNGAVSDETVRFQQCLHTAILNKLQPYGIYNRGTKRANLHMCRDSHMPAVLTENLFIDVASDAARLKQPNVIQTMIEGHMEGVANYLQLQRKKKEQPEPAPAPPQKKNTPLYVNGVHVTDALIIDGISYAPVRSLAESLHAEVHWEAAKQQIHISKK